MLAGGSLKIGLGQGAEFHGHFGLSAEPQLKTAHRLMQQHAEPVGGAQAFGSCRFDQRRDQRHIDQIGDNGVTGQSPNIGTEFRLPGHAERGGVDEQGRLAEQVVQLFPRGDLQTFEEALAQNIDSVPAKRLGTADEFGATCAFLCSAQAGYITGQNFLIDGGRFPGAF